MSQHSKINGTLLSVIISAFGAWGNVSWVASSKAQEIMSQGEDIQALKAADRSTQALLQRLDERTIRILETLQKRP